MLDADRMPGPDVLAALPIFPLPNVVFLPGMVLPLNVFEPRYLDLVDHVLDTGMHIGIPLIREEPAMLEPADSSLPVHDIGHDQPVLEAVFGVGQLIAHQRLPDGRRFIRLEGLGRVHARAECELDDCPFRCVEVEALPEEQPDNGHALEILKAQIERMAETFNEDDRDMIHAVLKLDDARVIIYSIASFVPNVEVMPAVNHGRPMGTAVPHLRLQQRCLAATSTDRRVALLSARAQTLIDVLGESGSFRLH